MHHAAAGLQVISCDTKGFMKYWDAETHVFPAAAVSFKSMFATNLMDCVKSGLVPKAVAVSKAGDLLAISCSDLSVLVIDFKSGKLRQRFDASMQVRLLQVLAIALSVSHAQSYEGLVCSVSRAKASPHSHVWHFSGQS